MLFTCNQCDNTFPLKQTLVRHIKYKHGNNDFKCLHCLKTFTRKDALHRHSKSHIYINDLSESSQNVDSKHSNSSRSNESVENVKKRMRFTRDLNDTVSDYSSDGKYVNDQFKTDNDCDSESNNSENSNESENGSHARLNIDKRIGSENYDADDESGSDKSDNESESDRDVLSETESSDKKSKSNTSKNDSETEVDIESQCSTCKSESVSSNSTKGSGDDSSDNYNSGNDQSSGDMDSSESDGNECHCRECRRDIIKNINKSMLKNKINNIVSGSAIVKDVSDADYDFDQSSENNLNGNRCPYRQYYTNQAKFGHCMTAVPTTGGSSGSLINGIMRTSIPLVVEKKVNW